MNNDGSFQSKIENSSTILHSSLSILPSGWFSLNHQYFPNQVDARALDLHQVDARSHGVAVAVLAVPGQAFLLARRGGGEEGADGVARDIIDVDFRRPVVGGDEVDVQHLAREGL